MEEGLDNRMYQSNKNGVMKISSKLHKDMDFKTTRAGSHHLEVRREGAIQWIDVFPVKKDKCDSC